MPEVKKEEDKEQGQNQQDPTQGQDNNSGKEFKLPEEYKDKKYLKGVDSEESLYKLLDKTQQLIGKRKEVNLPKEAKDYNISRGEGIESNEEYETAAKEMFHKTGLTEKQAQDVVSWLDIKAVEMYTSGVEAEDAKFEEYIEKEYGNTKDRVYDQVKEVIQENLPEEARRVLERADGVTLGALTVLIDNIRNKYMVEGGRQGFDRNKGGVGVKGGSKEAKIKQQMEELSKSDKYWGHQGGDLHKQHLELALQLNRLRDKQ